MSMERIGLLKEEYRSQESGVRRNTAFILTSEFWILTPGLCAIRKGV